MATTKTATRQLLDLMLEGQLDALVSERRDQGVPWRLIAREVYERTGVDITPQALRVWYQS
jgi:hypothetical protein